MKIRWHSEERCPHCGAGDWSKADTDCFGSAYYFTCNYCGETTKLKHIPDKEIIWDYPEEEDEYEDEKYYHTPISSVPFILVAAMIPLMKYSIVELMHIPLPGWADIGGTIIQICCGVFAFVSLITNIGTTN